MKFLKLFTILSFLCATAAQGYYFGSGSSLWQKKDISGDHYVMFLGEMHHGDEGHKQQLLDIILRECQKNSIDLKDVAIIVEDLEGYHKKMKPKGVDLDAYFKSTERDPYVVTMTHGKRSWSSSIYPFHYSLPGVCELYSSKGLCVDNIECRSHPLGLIERDVSKILESVAQFDLRKEFLNESCFELFYKNQLSIMEHFREEVKKTGENKPIKFFWFPHIQVRIANSIHKHRDKKLIFVLVGASHIPDIEKDLMPCMNFKKIYQGKGKPAFNENGIWQFYLQPKMDLEKFFRASPIDIFSGTKRCKAHINVKNLICGLVVCAVGTAAYFAQME